jgi:putative endonuclease
MPGWVYIVTNRRNGTLYVGVTDDLARRAWGHRAGLVAGLTKKYGLTRLVFAEYYDDMRSARQRERNMKHWRRAREVRLILDQNPEWDDLYERLACSSWVAGSGPATNEWERLETQSAPGFSRNPECASRGSTSAQK